MKPQTVFSRSLEAQSGPEHNEPLARKVGHAVHSIFEKLAGSEDLLVSVPNKDNDYYLPKETLDNTQLAELALRNDPYAYNQEGRFVGNLGS